MNTRNDFNLQKGQFYLDLGRNINLSTIVLSLKIIALIEFYLLYGSKLPCLYNVHKITTKNLYPHFNAST